MSAPAAASKASRIPLVLGVLALLLSIGALGWTVARPARSPSVREFVLMMGEGEVLAGYNATCDCVRPIDDPNSTEMVVGEYHRWEPMVLTAYVGDTIRLTVKNPRSNDHSFDLQSQPGDFSGMTGTGNILGKRNSQTTTGTEKTIEFQALKPGVYRWICDTPQDVDNNKCDGDHPRMTGYLVILS